MIDRNVKVVLIVFALIGFAFLAMWLMEKLAANDTPVQPSVRLADLKTGTFVELELPASRVFVLRDFDNQLRIFSVPFSDSAYWLPEFDWAHPAIPCADFAPDNKDGMLLPDGQFRCRKPDQGEFFRREHAWSYDGKNLGYRTSDLKVPAYEVTEEALLITNWH